MTRTLSIGTTTCIECGQWYETIDEAVECENLDREEREAAEEDYLREQGYWQEIEDNELDIREAEFLRQLHAVNFERP